MTWFKLDDGFHCHPKVLEAGNEAVGLFSRCGSWSSQQLTNGFVPTSIALLYGGRDLVAALVEAGLFVPVDGGWVMHDYLDYNPSKDQVQADRAAAADRQKRARERAKAAREAKESAWARHAVTHSVTHGVTTGVTDADSHAVTESVGAVTSDDVADGLWEDFNSHAVTPPVSHTDVTPGVTVPPTRPDPTRSLPTEEKATTAPKRGTRIPEDFASTLTPQMIDWARAECPLVDIHREAEKFVDYWIAVPGAKGLKLDWTRTWKNRMRDQQERAEQLGTRAPLKLASGGSHVPYQNPDPSEYDDPGAWGNR